MEFVIESQNREDIPYNLVDQESIKSAISFYKNKKYFEAFTLIKHIEIEKINEVEFLNVIGCIYLKLGDYNKSIKFFEKIVKNNSHFPANHNLGIIYSLKGNQNLALTFFLKADLINPNDENNLKNIFYIIRNAKFSFYNKQIEKILLNLLNKKNFIRPRDFSNSVISILKLHPSIKQILNSFKQNKKILCIETVLKTLDQVFLFNKFICLTQLPDIDLERLIIFIRNQILLNYRLFEKNHLAIKFYLLYHTYA